MCLFENKIIKIKTSYEDDEDSLIKKRPYLIAEVTNTNLILIPISSATKKPELSYSIKFINKDNDVACLSVKSHLKLNRKIILNHTKINKSTLCCEIHCKIRQTCLSDEEFIQVVQKYQEYWDNDRFKHTSKTIDITNFIVL